MSILLLLTSSICGAQYLDKNSSVEDLNEFKLLLEQQSSYYQLSMYDFEAKIQEIVDIIEQQDSIPVCFLAYELERLIAQTIDRHANIRMDDFDEDDIEQCGLHFPFALASINGNVVALKRNRETNYYEYYSSAFPYLKMINGKSVDDFISYYAYRRTKSPKQARLSDGLRDIRDIGELYFKFGHDDIKAVNIVLTDGILNKKLTLPLNHKKQWWFDIGSLSFSREPSKFGRDENFDLNKLDKILDDSIAYLALPSMVSYDEQSKMPSYLHATMNKFNDAKALIIDIRGNGGGTREILKTLAGYIVQPEQSPWVANVAYVRSDQRLNEDIASMQARFLYHYDSDLFSDDDRIAIDNFNRTFTTEYDVNPMKFSSPYYMVLHTNATPVTYPIYILVNEECFSAASVFTSAFKGLPNVKIVGVNTNGSSGRSNYFYLKNSNIRVKLSTMLSFQRNGKTLDGNGTAPDMVIERNEEQVFGIRDSQLAQLIALIQNK